MPSRSAPICVLAILLSVCPALRGLEKQPNSEYHARRLALASKLQGGVALIFGADEPALEYESWRQGEDFYYLTGWNQPGAALLIEAAIPVQEESAKQTDKNAEPAPAIAPEPYREILFLPVRNPRLERYTGEKVDAKSPDASHSTGVDEVRPITDLQAELVRLLVPASATSVSLRPGRIYTLPEDAKAANSLDLAASATGGSRPTLHDLAALTEKLRMTKSAGEIALIRKASDASVDAHRAVMRAIKPGAFEGAISGLIDYQLKAHGCERPSYPSIVGSGPNATVLHYSADDRTMQSGDLVVIDAAGEYSMYASDITRTLPANGHFTPRQREIYNVVLGAQRAAIAAFVSGKSFMGKYTDRTNPNSLNKIAYDYVNTHGKDLHGDSLGKYWIHGLGHSVGIDVHDPYDYSEPFGPGSVFTIEPGVYIPEEHIGVRIEDTFYVGTDGKLVNLTGALPHTADEVEAAMRQ